MEKSRREFMLQSMAAVACLGMGRMVKASEAEVSALLAKAEKQIMEADNRQRLLQLIRTYESVLVIDPENYEALWSLGRYYLLLGGVYPKDQTEALECTRKAMDVCLRGMRTNPEFRALHDQGRGVWEACRALTIREIAALFYWNQTESWLWMYEKSPLEQLLSLNWWSRCRKIMTRMMEIDPGWAGGHPLFAWGLYYAALPRLLGGNLKKAEDFFARALEAGPRWLYIKWGRAQYLHAKKKDRDAFRKDLEWVISQDPKTADSPYPANVYFQRSAKQMLENIENYF